jgi:hypothetical protein
MPRSCLVLLMLSLLMTTGGCSRPATPAPADGVLATSANLVRARADDAVFQASAMDVSRLDPAIAARYGLNPGRGGALLLVTLRDADGDALAPDDLVLTATASVLPDPPEALELQHLQVDGLNDYVGVFAARAPANVQFHVIATRHGRRAELDTHVQLYPP